MIVFHGSIEIVKCPDVLHSYRSLDFGKGFYVTTVCFYNTKSNCPLTDIRFFCRGVINGRNSFGKDLSGKT